MADKTSLVINYTDVAGKKGTTSVTYANPNAGNLELKTLAQMLNNLTINTYVSTNRVDTLELDTAPNPQTSTLAIEGGDTITATGVVTTKAITYNGDGVLYISPSNNDTIVLGVQNVNDSYQFIAEKPSTLTGGAVTGTIYASETDNYKAASVDFTFIY